MGREEKEPREETASTSRDMLVVIGIGAKDTGVRKIGYPEFQAFAYLLQKEELFPDYIFNGSALPKGDKGKAIEFPQSPEMAKDLNFLTSLGFFRELTDPLAYELTSQAEKFREGFVKKLEAGGEITFDELRIMAGKLLSPDKKETLFKQSYQLYIDGLGKYT